MTFPNEQILLDVCNCAIVREKIPDYHALGIFTYSYALARHRHTKELITDTLFLSYSKTVGEITLHR